MSISMKLHNKSKIQLHGIQNPQVATEDYRQLFVLMGSDLCEPIVKYFSARKSLLASLTGFNFKTPGRQAENTDRRRTRLETPNSGPARTRCLLPRPARAASARPGLPAGLGLQTWRHPSEACGLRMATSSRTRRRGLGPSPSRGPAASRGLGPGPGGERATAAMRPPCWPRSGAGAVGASSGRLRNRSLLGAPVRLGLPQGACAVGTPKARFPAHG